MRYQEAKAVLLETAEMAKSAYGSDKAAIREAINNEVDFLSREIARTATSDAKARQQSDWLALYACKLHPKKGGRK